MTQRSFRGRFVRVIRAVAVAAAFSAPGAALAHSGGPVPSAEGGLPIAPISHGEMAIINQHLDEIVALAKVQTATEGPVRRLTNHFGVQFAYCGWGLAPGAVSREDSPFNPCAHAYLAAAKELLLAMADAPESRRRASAILERIDARRAASPEAGVICSSSGNMFNTAAIVRPKIADVVRDPATASAGVGLFLLFAGAAAVAAAVRRRVVDQDQERLDVL
ncbi:hypothetical protein IHQ68_08200 [Chelatococcus sambhunathii]|uniref:Uncharacterized protein n=1 Tax=Chelatococcus sambhunathii TaxID=363953 RepID=A0ABU1DER4_9HYPH|nr:hypothetical protein [Chelatococcus sambhunathii]MDR4306597.1 hypothetical protein [Chelatococcus sambhunathii]